MAEKLERQVLRGQLGLATRTSLWLIQEYWHEWRWGIRSSNSDAGKERDADEEHHMYETLGYQTLRLLFRKIAPNSLTAQEVFLDAGCGLGRAIIEAGRHPYVEVLGFDYSPALIIAAQANIKAARHKFRCPKVEISLGDANTYNVPDGVTTIFLFNPFRGEVMQHFMSSVEMSLARRPRRIRMVFANPMYFNPLEFPWLTQVKEAWYYDPHVDDDSNCRLRILFLETSTKQ